MVRTVFVVTDKPEAVGQAILERDRPYGLHRLGVTMHVYADTWAHQGFAGILDKINEVEDIEETSASGVFSSGLKRFINDILDVSKIEAGRMELESQPFDLRACVESALDLVAARADRDLGRAVLAELLGRNARDERLQHVFLADRVGKGLGSPFACKDEIAHA